MLRKLSSVVLLLLVGLSGMVPASAAANVPRFEKGPCTFQPPAAYSVECGALVVREDRSGKSNRTIRLAVAIIRADHSRADPIVFLNGGPGGYTLKNTARIIDAYKVFTQERDLILFDQRGIGYSDPALECPEVSQFYADTVGGNIAGFVEQMKLLSAVRTCHDNLSAQGINLSAYTTAASAADVNDLRVVLGYRTWNLLGVSYGTRLALITMRSFPAGIRSVILDSTIPPQISPLNGSIPGAFDVLFSHCAQDVRCNASYPNLKADFYNLVTQLTLHPIQVMIPSPATGQPTEVLVSGVGIVEGLYLALYQSALIPRLPRIIRDAHVGDYTSMATLILTAHLFDAGFGSLGAAYSVGCSEHLQSPLLCQTWNVPASAHANDPVTSSLPTLVLAGEFDPVTPPRYGQAAAKTLKNSFFFEFTGLGHGVSIADACPRQIMSNFLNTPTRKPDASCLSHRQILRFLPSDF